jgi:hypothetical protein
MITIEVQGFQSIAGATIQVEGFTALVGKSNIGKSAFIRAVRCALTNPMGTSFVRHGRDCARKSRKNAKTCDCFSSVHIVTDGFDLLWQKGDRINRYNFNGQEYDKPDRGVPDFLADVGLSLVKVGDKAGSIQVSDQFFPIFLLDQSGPAIAEAISDVSQLDNINSATKLVEKDRRGVMETRKVREKDVADLEAKLSKFDSLDEKLALVTDTEKALSLVIAQHTRSQALGRYLHTLESLSLDIAGLDALGKVEVPDSSRIVETRESALALCGYLVEANRRGREVKALGEAERALQGFPDDNPLQGVVEKLEVLRDWIKRLRRIKESFVSSEPADSVAIPEVGSLSDSVVKLRSMETFAYRLRVLTKASSEVQESLVKLEGEEQTISSALVPLNKTLSEIEVCPSCNRPLKGHHEHVETLFSFPD